MTSGEIVVGFDDSMGAAAALRHAIALAQAAGVASRGEVVAGRPVEGLIAVADNVDAPMIVVGHHGQGPLRGALLGATRTGF